MHRVTCVDKSNVLRSYALFRADAAYAEPIHGSAPDIAGTDQANPLSQVLSLALLLDHAGQAGAASTVRAAVESALADGSIRLTGRGTPERGTGHVTRMVCDHVADHA